MKKLNQYALLSAMMLTGAVGFTACSSDNDPAGDVNIGNGEVVKTQFAINIPYAGKGNTRMSDDIVQGQTDPEFRGMQNIRLMPFTLNSTGNTPLFNGNENIDNTITLGDITAEAGDYSAKVYKDVDVPIGTNAFLFYGEATKGANVEDKVNGAIIPSFTETQVPATTLNDISFRLKKIMKEDVTSTPQTELLKILNAVANVTTGDGDNKQTWANQSTLKTYYEKLITLKAGSAESIRLTLKNLYEAMENPTFENNEFAKAVKEEIENHFTTTEGQFEYLNTAANFADYPKDLPAGAVQIAWNTTDSKFEYTSEFKKSGTDTPTGETNKPTALNDYVYPSALYYTTSTTIKTDDSPRLTSPSGAWSAILATYTGNGTVTTTTQSIALVNTINYAVGRFDIKAAFASGEIKDKNEAVVNFPADGFKFKGVLVGGQKAVQWDFTVKEDESSQQTIYDEAVAGFIKQSGGDVILNRTLVFETVSATDEQLAAADGNGVIPVNFVLELENNSNRAFQGLDGIVPVGGTFYLVGSLKPTNDNRKVFEQDRITTATITINSLANARNVVPDLRAPKLELGLSVDLEWQEGLSQDVTID